VSTTGKSLPLLEPLIRPATAADATQIAQFNTLLARQTEARELDPDRVNAGVAALLADPAKGTYFLAELDGQVIGQLLVTLEWSDWRNGWFWWIQSLYVNEEFRGRGVFRALFAHVKQQAVALPDICGIRLYVEADNENARTTYERLGMKLTSYRLYEIDFVTGAAAAATEDSSGPTE
jgi:GNAT superfamily N-acetyltransferase